jgi:hypothetical protein
MRHHTRWKKINKFYLMEELLQPDRGNHAMQGAASFEPPVLFIRLLDRQSWQTI